MDRGMKKKFEKFLQNPLTNPKEYDTITMSKGQENKK
jgi:hypothetical protein